MRILPGALCALALISTLQAAEAAPLELDAETEARCLEVLRAGLASSEFWPSMHAAEGLSLGGYGAEVTATLTPLLGTETDGQKRCGLARELVRAGDRSKTSILLGLLAEADPYAHVHAAESLFKVNQIGDGTLLRAALTDRANASKSMMAAAALSRWGNGEALAYLREMVQSEDADVAKIAAWVLGQVGDKSDIAALKAGATRFDDPDAKSFFIHALAGLKDPQGIQKLALNLKSEVVGVRTMAANFAGEIGLVQVRESLKALLSDENLDVRVRAAQSLLMLAKPASKPVGVITNDPYPATAANPRYSEGDITVLNDGRYLYATTEFMNDASDFAKARLVSRISADGGLTWGEQTVLQENVGGFNVMSLTFQALNDTEVGLFYLVKNTTSELNVYLRRSADDGLSFGEATPVTSLPGYHVMNNDRVIRLKSGRLLAPTASSADVEKENHFVCRAWISDDAGVTWRAGSGTVDYAQRGAMEPEVLEMNDGRVLMIIRTQLGHIAAAWSEDGGETWSAASDWGVRAPEAPSTLRRIPSTGDLMLVWNDTYVEGEGHGGKRSPLTLAISKDEGKTWEHKKNIETGAGAPGAPFMSGFSYISATLDGGRVLLTYYVAEEGSDKISSRFRSIPIAWLYE
jgi:sialidase-1